MLRCHAWSSSAPIPPACHRARGRQGQALRVAAKSAAILDRHSTRWRSQTAVGAEECLRRGQTKEWARRQVSVPRFCSSRYARATINFPGTKNRNNRGFPHQIPWWCLYMRCVPLLIMICARNGYRGVYACRGRTAMINIRTKCSLGENGRSSRSRWRGVDPSPDRIPRAENFRTSPLRRTLHSAHCSAGGAEVTLSSLTASFFTVEA